MKSVTRSWLSWLATSATFTAFGGQVLSDRPNVLGALLLLGLGSLVVLLGIIFSDVFRDIAARRAVTQAQSEETATVDPLRKEGAE